MKGQFEKYLERVHKRSPELAQEIEGVQARSQPLAKRKNSLVERKGKLIGLKSCKKPERQPPSRRLENDGGMVRACRE